METRIVSRGLRITCVSQDGPLEDVTHRAWLGCIHLPSRPSKHLYKARQQPALRVDTKTLLSTTVNCHSATMVKLDTFEIDHVSFI